MKHLAGNGLPVVSKILGYFLAVINTIIPKSSKIVIFDSFYGTQFSDSPKVVYDQMKEDYDFKKMRLFWTFTDPHITNEVPAELVLRKNSFKYIYYMCRAKFWISNSDIERLYGTVIPKRGHIYINTWHGIPLKFLGKDEHSITKNTLDWFNKVDFDLLTASSSYDHDIFCHIFPNTSPENIKSVGLPRNDELVSDQIDVSKIKKNLKIETYRQVILYAPTYRDTDVIEMGKAGSNSVGKVIIPKDLPADTVVLIRGHYFEKWNSNERSENVINVSSYANINDLYAVADVLISDYSSVIFDYALLNKPILLYTYDLDKYTSMRGMYRKVSDLGLPVFKRWHDLIAELNTNDGHEMALKKTLEFKKHYVGSNRGIATNTVLEYIKQKNESW